MGNSKGKSVKKSDVSTLPIEKAKEIEEEGEGKHVKEEEVHEFLPKNESKISWHSEAIDHHSEYNHETKAFHPVAPTPKNISIPVGSGLNAWSKKSEGIVHFLQVIDFNQIFNLLKFT